MHFDTLDTFFHFSVPDHKTPVHAESYPLSTLRVPSTALTRYILAPRSNNERNMTGSKRSIPVQKETKAATTSVTYP